MKILYDIRRLEKGGVFYLCKRNSTLLITKHAIGNIMSIDALPIIPRNKIKDGQFLFTKSQLGLVNANAKITLGKWNIFLYGGVHYISVRDMAGVLIGLFIGCLVNYKAKKIIREDLRFDICSAINGNNWEKELEDFIYQFGGSFLFVLNYNDIARVYLDANGSKSLVYDYDKETVSSTSGMLLDDDQYQTKFDLELYQFLDVVHDGWFPSGLTAHHGIKRLLCNHYLDLNFFNEIRHWPKNDFDKTYSTIEVSLRIAEIVKQQVETLVIDSSTICALTGGNETRFILAACLSMIDELEFCTVSSTNSKKDVYLAKRIAEKLELKHRLLPMKIATNDEQCLWQYLTGHCIGGSNMYLHPTIQGISNYKYFVGGLGGEIGRAFFWRQFDSAIMQLDVKNVVSRFGMQVHPRIVEATNKWFSSVKDYNPLTQLDLAYMELRMSAWAFSQSYASPSEQIELHPLICRESYTLMMHLPVDAKKNNLFIKEGIKQLCPQLTNIPINRYGNYRDLTEILNKVADIRRVHKKIRKLGLSI